MDACTLHAFYQQLKCHDYINIYCMSSFLLLESLCIMADWTAASHCLSHCRREVAQGLGEGKVVNSGNW